MLTDLERACLYTNLITENPHRSTPLSRIAFWNEMGVFAKRVGRFLARVEWRS